MSERTKEAVRVHVTKAQKAAVVRQSESAIYRSSPNEHVIHIQKTIGNQAVQKLFKSGAMQAKLKIGAPNDIYEQEADRVAEQVMRMPERPIQTKPC